MHLCTIQPCDASDAAIKHSLLGDVSDYAYLWSKRTWAYLPKTAHRLERQIH